MKILQSITILIALCGIGVSPASAQWLTSGSNVFYNGGNVGIGTGNPAHQLEVRSSAARAIYGLATATSGTTFGIYGQNKSTSGRGIFGYATASTGTNYGVFGKTNSDDGFAGYFIGGQNYFQGNVGIGTTAPQQALSVAGGIVVDQGSQSDGSLFNALTFGNNSQEGIVSNRVDATPGNNQFGLDIYTAETKRVSITNDGLVGLGRVPTTNVLEVEGEASKTIAGDWAANSDARIKTNIQTVTDALNVLDQVRLVSFNYTADYRTRHPKIQDRRYLNVIAQEFAQVFPEYVKSSGEKLRNGDDILQVDAYPLTIYSAAAIQELHAAMNEKDQQIARLENSNRELRERMAELEAMVQSIANRVVTARE